jgi:ankyrin repeat protein
MSTPSGASILYTVLGLNRAGQILYTTLFVLAVPALLVWTVVLPRLRFSDQDEMLFQAARHGNREGVEHALAAGADVDAVAPVDRKTALFRAAIFGHAEVVRLLLDRGASTTVTGSDGRSVLEVTTEARANEKDPAVAHALESVATVLRQAKAGP